MWSNNLYLLALTISSGLTTSSAEGHSEIERDLAKPTYIVLA